MCDVISFHLVLTEQLLLHFAYHDTTSENENVCRTPLCAFTVPNSPRRLTVREDLLAQYTTLLPNPPPHDQSTTPSQFLNSSLITGTCHLH